MANSPLLQIPQVAPNQSSKEVTINDGVAILERSLNDLGTLDLSAGNGNLDITNYTRAFLIRCSGHSVARDVTVPLSKRFFSVHNAGTGIVTVKPISGGGSTVAIPVGSLAVLFNDGAGLIKISDSAASAGSLFTALTDTPANYTGQAGKVVAVKTDETGLEFITGSAGATLFTALTDTPANYTGSALKVVRVNSGATGLEFVAASALGTTAFTGLTDVPHSYASQGLKLVRVKGDESGLEFTALPPAVVRVSRSIGLLNAGFESGLASWNVDSGAGWAASTSLGGITPETGTKMATYSGAGTTGGTLSQVFDLTTIATTTELDNASQVTFAAAEQSTTIDTAQMIIEFLDSAGTSVLGTATGAAFTANGGGWVPRTLTGDAPTGTRKVRVKLTVANASGSATEMAFDDLVATLRVSVDQISNFTQLSDVPSSYSGAASKLVRVNAAGTGLEFITPSSVGSTTFTGLTDTPANFGGFGGYIVRVKIDESGLEFVTAGATGAVHFTDLTDAPSSYSGAAYQKVRVKATADGVEFASDLTINSQTANYTAVLADIDATIIMTAATGLAFTVPANATTAFPVGTQMMVSQGGAGAVTITPAVGVTINTSASSLLTNAQYQYGMLKKVAANEWDWILFGSGSGTGGATTLAALTDVAIGSPTNGQGLIYNSTSGKWENQAISGGSGTGTGGYNMGSTVFGYRSTTFTVDKTFNVTPTRTGVGRYRVTFASTLADDKYGLIGSAQQTAAGTSKDVTLSIDNVTGSGRTTGHVDILFTDDTGAVVDPDYAFVSVVDPTAGTNVGIPYDVGTFVADAPTASEVVFRTVIPRSITLPANGGVSAASAGTAATASTVFAISKNGTSIGSITFAISGSVGTFATSGGAAVSFAAGDVLAITGPSTADATLKDISILLACQYTLQVAGLAGASNFVQLADVPASYSGASLKSVRVNSGATGLEFFTPVVATFITLSDAPTSYSGQAKKAVRVNAGATGLEFYGPAIANLTDVDIATVAPTDGQALVWNAAASKFIPGSVSSGGGGSGSGTVTVPLYEKGDFAPPLASWFSTLIGGPGTVTRADAANQGMSQKVTGGTGQDQIHLAARSVSGWGSAWRVRARLVLANNMASFPSLGLWVYDSGSSKIQGIIYENSGVSGLVHVQNRTNLTTYSGNATTWNCADPPQWFELELVSGNLKFRVSWDGIIWQEHSYAANNFLPAITHIGIGGTAFTNDGPATNPMGFLCTYYHDPDFPASGHTVTGSGSSTGGSAPVLVQSAKNATRTGTSHAVTIATPTAGNLLVALVSGRGSIDSANPNPYKPFPPAGWNTVDWSVDNTGTQQTALYMRVADGTEGTTVTFTQGSADNLNISILEMSGVGDFDYSMGVGNIGTNTQYGGFAGGASKALAFTMFEQDNTLTVSSVATGWTNLHAFTGDGNNHCGVTLQYTGSLVNAVAQPSVTWSGAPARPVHLSFVAYGLAGGSSSSGAAATGDLTTAKLTSNSSTMAWDFTNVLSWNAATGSAWASGQPTRITTPSGKTKMRLTVGVTMNSGSNLYLLVRRNGSTVEYMDVSQSVSTGQRNFTTPWLTVSAGDYFEILVNPSGTSNFALSRASVAAILTSITLAGDEAGTFVQAEFI